MTKETENLKPDQYIEDGEIMKIVSREIKNWGVVCSFHGGLGIVPANYTGALEKQHRNKTGCSAEIKVYEEEEYKNQNHD